MDGGGLRIVQATEEEQAAITQLLKERAAAAPGGAPAVGASAPVSAGLRLAGVLFVVAGMGGGLGDLVHLHESGGGPAHHAAVRREDRNGTMDHGPQDYGGKADPSPPGFDAARRDPGDEHRTSNILHRTLNAERGPAECGPVYVFRWTGRDWMVVFGGGEPFYLEDTLGARYLDYLLHHPNVPITAFELEVAVQPQKGEARSRNSIQPESDPQARREYREELQRLEVERAEAAGEPEEVARLTSEIEALKSALKGVGAADTGERARVNVRKAVVVVLGQLRKRGREEQALAEHLRRHLSTGYECLYSLEEGRWG